MKRIPCLIISICFFLAGLTAEEPLFRSWVQEDQALQLLPRSSATIVINIENKSIESIQLAVEAVLPEGWKQLIPIFPMTLAGGESDFLLLNFFVPRGTLKGIYQVRYIITDQASQAHTLTNLVPVTILEEKTFELKLMQIPEYVIAGEEYQIRYLLINTGNTELNFKLITKSSGSFPVTIKPEAAEADPPTYVEESDTAAGTGEPPTGNFQLAAGAAGTININVKTTETITRILDHRVTLMAGPLTEEPPDGNLLQTITETTYVEVIPRISGNQELYHRLPLDVKYNTTHKFTNQYTGNLGINMYSKGYLDEEGRHRLELEVNKELDFPGTTFINAADQYTLEYNSAHIQLAAGDRGYMLSPLTENFSYARGVEADVSFYQFNTRVYYQKNIWNEASLHHTGGYFNYTLYNDNFPGGWQYSAALNALGKIPDSLLFSLYQQYKPVKPMLLEAEVATGSFLDSELAWAWLVKGNGDHKWITYDLEYLHAEPQYPGAYNNLSLLAGHLGFRLLGNALKLFGGYQYEKHNLDLDPSLTSAALNRNAQAGIEYYLPPLATQISFLWKNNDKQDRLEEPGFNNYENIFKLMVSQPIAGFKILPSAEWIIFTDRAEELTAWTQDYYLGLEYNALESAVFNFFFDYTRNRDTEAAVWQKLAWGISGNLNFQKLLLDLHFKNSYDFDMNNRNNMEFNLVAAAGYTFENNTQLSANLNSILFSSNSEWDQILSLALEYKTPFQIPLARKKNIGTIMGKVSNSLLNMPLSGIILKIGGFSSVSDQEGNYIFPALEPGEYYLNISRKGIKDGYIPATDLPVKINLESGATVVMDIAITEEAVVSGKIDRYDFTATQDIFIIQDESGNGLATEPEYISTSAPGLLVEISNGVDVKRRITDKNGHFLFEELVPGNWKMKILDYGIPEYHYLEQDTFEVTLNPGDIFHYEIRILPQKRAVKIIEDGGFLIAE